MFKQIATLGTGMSRVVFTLEFGKNALLESVYAVQAGALYAAGVSDEISEWLAKPRKQRPDYCGRTFPVILLHGVAHNQSWAVKVERELEEAGFICKSINYRTVGRTVEQAADEVNETIKEVMRMRGCEKIHVAGHSLGGLVLRQALARHPELDDVIVTGMTIGTPHNGTPLASKRWGFLPIVGDLITEIAPNSEMLQTLNNKTKKTNTRWVCIWSPDDELVPGTFGQLTHPELEVVDKKLRGVGHAGLMYDNRAVETIVSQMIQADDAAMTDMVEEWARKHKNYKKEPLK